LNVMLVLFVDMFRRAKVLLHQRACEPGRLHGDIQRLSEFGPFHDATLPGVDRELQANQIPSKYSVNPLTLSPQTLLSRINMSSERGDLGGEGERVHRIFTIPKP